MIKNYTLFFLLIVMNGFAQSLDPSFGTSGIVNSQFSNTSLSDTCYTSIIQPDGKTIICGLTNDVYLPNARFVARFNSDGTLDSSFGNNGIQLLNNVNLNGIQKIQLLSNGKILLCSQYSLLQLNSNGSYDTTFGTNGLTDQILLSSSNYIFNESMTLQSDGKIITVGFGFRSTNKDFVIVRYNIDGTIDTTYGTNGIAQIDLGTNYDHAYDVAIQTDEKIIVTGQNGSSISDVNTIRVNTNGTIDTSFGNSGKVTYSTSNADSGRGVVIQPDGKIVVLALTNGYPAYFRYSSGGTLDTTFNSVGYKIDTFTITTDANPLGSDFITPKMILLDSGKFIISGTSNTDFVLKKINSDGSNDLTFGNNGLSTYDINSNDFSKFVYTTNTGSIFTGGYTFSSTSISSTVTLEFNQNGTYVNSRFFNYKSSEDVIAHMIEQSNGKFVVINKSSDNNYPGLTIRRYNSNGTPDNSFGINGVSDTQTSCGYNDFPSSDKCIKLNDGKIVLLNFDFGYLYKFTSEGIPDPTFGINGFLDLSSISNGGVLDGINQGPDNKIYVLFDNYLSSQQVYDFGVLRLLDDGTIDTTFGVNGIFHTRFDYFNTNNSNEFPEIMCFQSNGSLIVSGIIIGYSPYSVVTGIMRINPNGTIDTSFGTNGKAIITVPNYNISSPADIVCLYNDDFLMNIVAKVPNSLTATLKFKPDGSLDTNFGNNGYVYDLNFNRDMILQPDGKILKGGQSYQSGHFSTTRFNVDGSIDTSFGNNGYLETTINDYSKINSLVLAQNGDLVAGGFSSAGRVTYATLVRYTNLNLGVLSFINQNNLLVYPNPIQTQTTFDYTLEEESQISIGIYNIEGKLMSEISKNEIQQAGKHQLNINMSNYSAGTYILKLISNKGQHSIHLLKE